MFDNIDARGSRSIISEIWKDPAKGKPDVADLLSVQDLRQWVHRRDADHAASRGVEVASYSRIKHREATMLRKRLDDLGVPIKSIHECHDAR